MTPCISVLMPVYNAERYLAEAVESILGQTYRDFEFLIVDDGSSDSSLSILRRYEASDGRIRLTSRANTGYVVALNQMLSVAQGEFVARMDADDVSIATRFARQLSLMREKPSCVAVGSRALLIDPDGAALCEMFGQESHDAIDAAFLSGQGGEIPHPAAFIRRDAIRKIGGYRAEFWPAEDVDLFLRLAECGVLTNIPEVLLKYRVHAKSTGHLQKRTQIERAMGAAAEARKRRGLPPSSPIGVDNEERDSPAGIHRRWAWWALQGANVSTARSHALAALRLAPFSVDTWRVLYCALRGH